MGGNGLGECFARRIEHDAIGRTRDGGRRTGETGFERDDSTRTVRGESDNEVVEVVAVTHELDRAALILRRGTLHARRRKADDRSGSHAV